MLEHVTLMNACEEIGPDRMLLRIKFDLLVPIRVFASRLCMLLGDIARILGRTRSFCHRMITFPNSIHFSRKKSSKPAALPDMLSPPKSIVKNTCADDRIES